MTFDCLNVASVNDSKFVRRTYLATQSSSKLEYSCKMF